MRRARTLVVQKFGGTSVAGPRQICLVADKIIKTWKKGLNVVVVVSAPGTMTDDLLKKASVLSKNPARRELDVLLSTGEQQSIALLAIAIGARGIPAISLTGLQGGILTDRVHTEARIVNIELRRVREGLRKRMVVIVAGFQGVNAAGDLTTLGRGGSDLTAVALAVRLRADRCELYKDVDGIYTADPRKVPSASKINVLTYEEMLELSSLGASILHSRSVELAGRFRMPLHIRPTFSPGEGTKVINDSNLLERPAVRGMTVDRNQAKITLRSIPDRPGVAARVFEEIAKGRVEVDVIVQNMSQKKNADLTFTVNRRHLSTALARVRSVAKNINAGKVEYDENIAKVSMVGVGMRSHAGVASTAFRALARAKINIQMITTSEIRISCIVARKDADSALRVLHRAFGLGQKSKKSGKASARVSRNKKGRKSK